MDLSIAALISSAGVIVVVLIAILRGN